MELWFMGTNAGMPIAERNVTSIVLRMPQNRGTFWLFDCGEGTQHQLLRTPFKLSKLEKLFVTHLHGDHIFGLPGLLSSRSSLGVTAEMELYGPPGIRDFVENAFRISDSHLGYPLRIYEIGEGEAYRDEDFIVEAAALDHRIECFGYRITERPRTGALRTDWLLEIGVPAGPLFGLLKSGQDVALEDGRIIRSEEAVGSSLHGRVITVLGDTKPCGNAVALAKDADMLVHEATFLADLAEKAGEYGHSTSIQAAETARKAGAKRLLITHFSSRYKQEDLAELESEARSAFPNTEAATELKPYSIPRGNVDDNRQ
ncbi:ribonuclease Z [Cohnella lupini]|uniref:Ribonuclease Z n=1 Tax=Cohnella lupini TaxID=1294267 RepID=A0A3D9I1G7_9BACL|nr:ribonuclease Z [Cohnella lupini]RED55505.1 ribonuclease Z [Cohnella lupini]